VTRARNQHGYHRDLLEPTITIATIPQDHPAAARPLGWTPPAGVAGPPAGPAHYLVYAAWGIALFDPHYLLAFLVTEQAGRLATLTYFPLILLALARSPALFGSPRRVWITFPPLMLFFAVGAAGLFTAPNPGLARDTLKVLLPYFAMIVATADLIRTPRQAWPIVVMFVVRFAWWAAFSRQTGIVGWHPSLANYDAYGGLMVQGAGLCYWVGMGVKRGRVRWALFALAAFCVLGVVASFARGAFLSLVALAGVVWLRSPRKVVTGAAMILAAGLTFAGAGLLFEENFFWEEIKSAFTEGTSEGTGGQRMAMWGAAVEVWKEHPIFGVGAANFGAFASTFFRDGQIEQFPNPMMFYAFNLHNAYVQVLAEFGLVGTFAFLWMHWDFFRKNRDLQRPDFGGRWATSPFGRRVDLRFLAMGVEAAMIGVMLANFFYASLFTSWLFTTIAVNRMLWGVTRGDGRAPPAPPHSARPVRGPAQVAIGRLRDPLGPARGPRRA
jgi:O-antigen ligase